MPIKVTIMNDAVSRAFVDGSNRGLHAVELSQVKGWVGIVGL